MITADGRVPVRVARPTRDFRATLVARTELRLRAADAVTNVEIEYLDDGVLDPALRALDRQLMARPTGLVLDPVTPIEFALPPGTRFALRTVRDGVRGPPQSVVVEASGPQLVVVP